MGIVGKKIGHWDVQLQTEVSASRIKNAKQCSRARQSTHQNKIYVNIKFIIGSTYWLC